MPSEPVTVAPCGICQGLVEINWHTAYDGDLEQFICPDCAPRLVKVCAWLRFAGMPNCIRLPNRSGPAAA